MKSKVLYKILSMFSIVFGLMLLISTRLTPVGYVIGSNNLAPVASLAWGAFFITCGITLFYLQGKR